ncbi:vesicle-associated membrane protein 3, partial [Anguilla rostrata]|uniref:vesicle-associated membrane protein 3 n=1 Tax=Anguilla rostrata TaxID=7938 RepID=UPI0030CFC32C
PLTSLGLKHCAFLRRCCAVTCALCVGPQVVGIMRVNVDKVLERDQKLSELDDRADALQAGASQFETNAAKLKRKYWWRNMKMWGILIAVILIIIIIIIIWANS